MTAPVVTYGDAEIAVIDRLVAVWSGITEDYTPATDAISTEIPLPLPETSTAIQVTYEGSPDTSVSRARERAQVRITCWANELKRTWVKALAARCIAELEASPADAPDTGQQVGSFILQTGRSGVTQDPDTKNLAVWFLVTTNLRGKQL